MRVLTLTQPWATLMALGLKRIETRSWRTHYRGPLAIHAAKGFPPQARRLTDEERFRGQLPADLPFGAILCTVELVDCQPTESVAPGLVGPERLYGDYTFGRWAWLFRPDSLRVLEAPISARGALGLWDCAALEVK